MEDKAHNFLLLSGKLAISGQLYYRFPDLEELALTKNLVQTREFDVPEDVVNFLK